MQVADELEASIECANRHSPASLEAMALPGLPQDQAGYSKKLQRVVCQAHSVANILDAISRWDPSPLKRLCL